MIVKNRQGVLIGKHHNRIREINPVLALIRLRLPLIPFEFHV